MKFSRKELIEIDLGRYYLNNKFKFKLRSEVEASINSINCYDCVMIDGDMPSKSFKFSEVKVNKYYLLFNKENIFVEAVE